MNFWWDHEELNLDLLGFNQANSNHVFDSPIIANGPKFR